MKPQRLNGLHRAKVAVWYFTECSDFERQFESLKDLSRSRKFVAPDAIGSYFEMAYGLLNAFSVEFLPWNLSPEEKEVVKDISRRLSVFLQSDQVLRYFEMSTISTTRGTTASCLTTYCMHFMVCRVARVAQLMS